MKKSKKLTRSNIVLCALVICLAGVYHTYDKNHPTSEMFGDGIKEGIISFEVYGEYSKRLELDVLKLHPIGSDASALIKTLERSGAVFKPADNSQHKHFEYGKSFLNLYFWEIAVQSDDSGRIKDITINRTSPWII